MIAKVEIGMSAAAQKPNIYIFALVIANIEFIIECILLFSSIMCSPECQIGPRIYHLFMLSCGLS